MKLILIRHSKTTFSREIPICQWGLSEEGIQLAQDLSRNDLVRNLDVIYTSNQTKAIETALYLAKPNGIRMEVEPDLTEVTSFTRQLFDDHEKSMEEFMMDKVERHFGGESKKEALERFEKAMEKSIKCEGLSEKGSKEFGMRNLESRIGIVSHGTIFSLFTAKYSEHHGYEVHKNLQMPDVAVFDWGEKRFEKMWCNINKRKFE